MVHAALGHVRRQELNFSETFLWNDSDYFLHEQMQAKSGFAERLSESMKAHLHLKDYRLLSQGRLPFHLPFSCDCSAMSTFTFQTWRDYVSWELVYFKQTLAFVILEPVSQTPPNKWCRILFSFNKLTCKCLIMVLISLQQLVCSLWFPILFNELIKKPCTPMFKPHRRLWLVWLIGLLIWAL